MNLIKHFELKNIAGGIVSVITINRTTGIITYSSCMNMVIAITPDHAHYQKYFDILGDKDIFIL